MAQKTRHPTKRFGIFPKLLLVLVLVALLPLVFVWYLNYQTAMQWVTLIANDSMESVSDALQARVDDWLDMNVRMLRENAAAPGIRSMDPERQKPILEAIDAEYPWVHAVLVIAPDGESISRSDDKPMQNYSDRAYVRQILAGEAMGQQVLIGKTTGLPGLTLAVPVRGDDGTVMGILTISMATAVLSSYVTNVRIGDTGYAFLLDAEGRVIAHQSMEDETFRKDFSRHPAFVAFTKEGESSLVYRDEKTDRLVVAFMRPAGAGWALVTRQDHDEAFGAIKAANSSAILILVATLSVVLVVAYILSRRLTRPIQRLTTIANEASLARFTAIDTNIAEKYRSDEVGELARAVERLAVSLKVAIGRLQKKT